MRFDQYHMSDQLKRNLESLNFQRPTDIQYKTIPSVLKGEDVLAIAQTGTGKTAAFAIPIVDKIHSRKSSKRVNGIRCIVMVPTRELALQIGGVFEKLALHTKVSIFTLYGGTEQDEQIRRLQGGIDILITTPGRMFDLIHQGFIELQHIDTFVLDEADHMLDLGFIEDIKYVKKMLTRQHQTVFMSATINPEIKKIAYSLVKGNAIRIQLSPKDPVSKNVDHFVMFIKMDDKRFFLESFMRENEGARVIVFVRTRVRAERVMKAMARVEIESRTLHGEMEQKDRTEVLGAFRKGEFNILIATDISARGIDVPEVKYVINYDLPVKTENYVHRVGRTGRGTNRGTAISYCSIEEKPQLEAIEAFLDKPIDEIKVGKKTYAHTVEVLSRTNIAENQTFAELEALVQEKGMGDNRRLAKRKSKRR
jgi:ATP-dependent RNA helicase RhlE